MTWLTKFFTSTIGMKVLMALTGLVLFGFVVVHMLGNFQIFLGPDVYNHYAALLQGQKEILWAARLTLLASVVLHIVSATVLTLRSKKARPQGYQVNKWLSGSYAVRTMRFGGVILLAFIVFHLAQFTLGVVAVDGYRACAGSAADFHCFAYQNFVSGFKNPAVVGFYVVAQAFLGLHLAHGVWSMLRTLGMTNPRHDTLARRGATAFGIAMFVGNAIMPIAVLVGVVK